MLNPRFVRPGGGTGNKQRTSSNQALLKSLRVIFKMLKEMPGQNQH